MTFAAPSLPNTLVPGLAGGAVTAGASTAPADPSAFGTLVAGVKNVSTSAAQAPSNAALTVTPRQAATPHVAPTGPVQIALGQTALDQTALDQTAPALAAAPNPLGAAPDNLGLAASDAGALPPPPTTAAPASAGHDGADDLHTAVTGPTNALASSTSAESTPVQARGDRSATKPAASAATKPATDASSTRPQVSLFPASAVQTADEDAEPDPKTKATDSDEAGGAADPSASALAGPASSPAALPLLPQPTAPVLAPNVGLTAAAAPGGAPPSAGTSGPETGAAKTTAALIGSGPNTGAAPDPTPTLDLGDAGSADTVGATPPPLVQPLDAPGSLAAPAFAAAVAAQAQSAPPPSRLDTASASVSKPVATSERAGSQASGASSASAQPRPASVVAGPSAGGLPSLGADQNSSAATARNADPAGGQASTAKASPVQTSTSAFLQPSVAATVVAAGAQPSAAASSAVPATPAPVQTIANLSTQIVKQSDGKTSRFDLQLDPIGLGRVDVAVQIDAKGRATASLSFDRADSAALLADHAGALADALGQAGLTLAPDGTSFSHRAAETPAALGTSASGSTSADASGQGSGTTGSGSGQPGAQGFASSGQSFGQSFNGGGQDASQQRQAFASPNPFGTSAFDVAASAADSADQQLAAYRALQPRGLDIRI